MLDVIDPVIDVGSVKVPEVVLPVRLVKPLQLAGVVDAVSAA